MVNITGNNLTREQVLAVAREGEAVAPFDEAVQSRLMASSDWVDRAINEAGSVIYGVNTGFGPLATKTIAAEEAGVLSRNVILACLTGVGPALPGEVVRAMMLIRANTFANGYSGVRPVVAETLRQMLNAGVTPYVPSKGSLGASGDLTPLAYIAVVLTRDSEEVDGESGRAWYQGELLEGSDAMRRAGIPRLVLRAKEGLSLTNGTDMMMASAALALSDGMNLLENAQIAAALSLEALLGL
ncbi:MAG: aromatic amino acid ammonia-lyase, partial [Anaerolineales bacterium]|nr:aromatic amino acid ammonia-lyase [Anaerolineales bacterium]